MYRIFIYKFKQTNWVQYIYQLIKVFRQNNEIPIIYCTWVTNKEIHSVLLYWLTAMHFDIVFMAVEVGHYHNYSIIVSDLLQITECDMNAHMNSFKRCAFLDLKRFKYTCSYAFGKPHSGSVHSCQFAKTWRRAWKCIDHCGEFICS